MACSHCRHLGYIETQIAWGGGYRPAIKQCPECKDVRAYSNRISDPALNCLSAHVEKVESGWRDPAQPPNGRIISMAEVLKQRRK